MSSDLSDPDPDIDAPAQSSSKRRSGRVSRKPDTFAAPPSSSSKRKRDELDDQVNLIDQAGDDDEDDDDEDDEDDESETEGEPDEEELREKRARARKTNQGPATKTTTKRTPAAKPTAKPTAKRSKPNGHSVSLPVRGQAKATSKKAKAANQDDAEKAGGLYGQSHTRIPTKIGEKETNMPNS